MGLAELQAAVAWLCTDPAARQQLQEDPVTFARAAGLAPSELASLSSHAALETFARALLSKRRREVGQAIPLTRNLLGSGFRASFAQFAAATGVARDPVRDAIAYLGWLSRQEETPRLVRYQARHEAAGLSLRRGWRRWHAGFYRLTIEGRHGFRWYLAIWWRPWAGTRCCYWVFPVSWW